MSAKSTPTASLNDRGNLSETAYANYIRDELGVDIMPGDQLDALPYREWKEGELARTRMLPTEHYYGGVADFMPRERSAVDQMLDSIYSEPLDTSSIAYQSPIDLETVIANRVSWESLSVEGTSSFIQQVELGFSQKNNYDVIKDGWSTFGEQTIQRLDQAAIQDGGGILTGIAAFVRMPAQIGFALGDLGLTLGEVLYDTTQYVFGDSTLDFSVFDGADVRWAVGFKSGNVGSEVKMYGGTDFDLAFSAKNIDSLQSVIPNRFINTKENVSVHLRAPDLLDPDTWRTDFMAEIDQPKAIDLYNFKRYQATTSLTLGTRGNIYSGDLRGSANFKLELPKSVTKYTFGWTPSVGIEVRK